MIILFRLLISVEDKYLQANILGSRFLKESVCITGPMLILIIVVYASTKKDDVLIETASTYVYIILFKHYVQTKLSRKQTTYFLKQFYTTRQNLH